MFKNQPELLKLIQHDDKVLEALDGLNQLTPHMHTLVEDFLIENLSFRRPSTDYDKVQLLWDRAHTTDLIQYHIRIAPKDKSSYRTSKYSLAGDWTAIVQVVLDHHFTVKHVICLERSIVERHQKQRPWTIGKCIKLGEILFPAPTLN